MSRQAALRELRRAVEKFGELELPYATAQAQRRAAQAAARTGDKTAAVELLHAAHDTAGRLVRASCGPRAPRRSPSWATSPGRRRRPRTAGPAGPARRAA